MARGRKKPLIKIVLFLAIVAAGTWGVWGLLKSAATHANGNAGIVQTAIEPPSHRVEPPAPPVDPVAIAEPQVAVSGNPMPEVDAGKSAAAESELAKGVALLAEGNLVAARQSLSNALSSGALGVDKADQCRSHLREIADKLVFSREIVPGDPFAYRYVIRAGDVLVNVVRRENVLVPAEGIMLINGITDPRRLQIGQPIKLVRGPFNAIVTKHTFTLDLYQHGVFVKSYKVGLGQNGSTPEGKFVVAPGGRVRHAPWAPPPSSGQTRAIRWNEPGYPLGREGLWIALQGVEPRTETLTGYGIHGTDEPDSIGRQGSLGCIRMGDDDIEEIFSLLMDGHSQVEVRP